MDDAATHDPVFEQGVAHAIGVLGKRSAAAYSQGYHAGQRHINERVHRRFELHVWILLEMAEALAELPERN